MQLSPRITPFAYDRGFDAFVTAFIAECDIERDILRYIYVGSRGLFMVVRSAPRFNFLAVPFSLVTLEYRSSRRRRCNWCSLYRMDRAKTFAVCFNCRLCTDVKWYTDFQIVAESVLPYVDRRFYFNGKREINFRTTRNCDDDDLLDLVSKAFRKIGDPSRLLRGSSAFSPPPDNHRCTHTITRNLSHLSKRTS